ncbi:Protein of unknown function [Meinhardsimonia xiamenensis]|jgi:hypothetical protein|uniref:DUF2948 family protein n=1 Tax=Meinhardsimonia xiamenensis TaxID=990712 RepID=A0A1G9C860_9RHOB|nr:DUF2948 family protein [Meinhardsimonia xiamenensis]PRX38456.1 Protein of unknown function (DUF2948) [Meinhardsimonia xiamenensis]SDK47840.1 Protein of unknown function [Meinhardsimonia xiamenensis]
MARDATDARFEDVPGDEPLRLLALDEEDLKVIAALAQDAVFPVSEIRWLARERRLAILLNRFRWEDKEAAEREGRPYERVRSLLVIDNVLHVASQGFDRSDDDLVLSLLDIEWEPGDPPGGRLVLVLAGDGAIAVDVEAIEVGLKDVTKPYVAPSGKAPDHGV